MFPGKAGSRQRGDDSNDLRRVGAGGWRPSAQHSRDSVPGAERSERAFALQLGGGRLPRGNLHAPSTPAFGRASFCRDPNEPIGWGAIQVKDWNGGIYDYVNVGDWVTVTNVVVEEFRGTTMLQWYASHDPGYEILSVGNPLPPPLIVPVSAMLSPECTGSDPNDP